MKTFFTLFSAIGLIYSISWFARFQLNPYSNCIDFPNKDLEDDYYLCQPFGFKLRKGVLESSNSGVKALLPRPIERKNKD